MQFDNAIDFKQASSDVVEDALRGAVVASTRLIKQWSRGWRSSFTKALIRRYSVRSEHYGVLLKLHKEGMERKTLFGEVELLVDELVKLSIEIERGIHETFMARTNVALTIVISLATICGVVAQVIQVVQDCR